MRVPKEMSLPVYLRQNNIHYADSIEYEVSPQVDLVSFQAHHLAEMQSRPLHPSDLLKAILHIPGSPAEKLLVQQGITLEKIHSTPLNPNDPPYQCQGLFDSMIKYAHKNPVISLEHMLLALLEEDVLRPYFATWHVDLDAFYKQAYVQAG